MCHSILALLLANRTGIRSSRLAQPEEDENSDSTKQGVHAAVSQARASDARNMVTHGHMGT